MPQGRLFARIAFAALSSTPTMGYYFSIFKHIEGPTVCDLRSASPIRRFSLKRFKVKDG